MAVPQVPDAELVETFIGQADRYTHSGFKLRNCFSRTASQYGSVLQISAVRQALIACILLPAVDHPLAPSVRHMTFEKHLDNLLVHVLRTIASDSTVASYDRDIANLLVETAADRKRTPIVTDKKDQEAAADIDTITRQLDQQLKKVLGVRD